MSIEVLTLEQICKEYAGSHTILESSTQGGASSNGVSYPSTSGSMHLSDVLRHLVKVLTLPLSLDDMLCSLATLTMQATKVDLCVIMLMDELRGHLSVRTCLPDLSDKGVIIEPIDVDSVLWGRLRDYMARGQLPELTTDELESLNPLKNVQYEMLLPLPLIVGTEYIGVINCYSSKTQYWTNDEQLMLITIASQAALAIKHLQRLGVVKE